MAKAAAKNPLEVKVGVQYSPREITLEVSESADQIRTIVEKAVTEGGVIELTDVRGRQVLIPAASCSYVEIGPPETRRVGFGAD